jgi:hypothetical protein
MVFLESMVRIKESATSPISSILISKKACNVFPGGVNDGEERI